MNKLVTWNGSFDNQTKRVLQLPIFKIYFFSSPSEGGWGKKNLNFSFDTQKSQEHLNSPI